MIRLLSNPWFAAAVGAVYIVAEVLRRLLSHS